MSHSNLLRYFGYSWDLDSPYGVILRTAPSTVSNIAAPRASVKDSYDCILEDCDYAIANGPDANPNYYTNKWVAKGLKARGLIMLMRDTMTLPLIRICMQCLPLLISVWVQSCVK